MDDIVHEHNKILRAKISHADAIADLELAVNSKMGGDAEIADIVGLMVVMGWKRPSHNPDQTG